MWRDNFLQHHIIGNLQMLATSAVNSKSTVGPLSSTTNCSIRVFRLQVYVLEWCML